MSDTGDAAVIEGLTLLVHPTKKYTIWAEHDKLGAGGGDPRGLSDDTKARLLVLGWFIDHECDKEDCDGTDCENAEYGSWTHFV